MKLEENMYVRTKYGISQYKYYDTSKEKLLCIPVKDGSRGVFANVEDIINASFNIIDLIEVGDYVNGYLVIEKPYKYHDMQFVSLDTRDSWGYGCGEMPIKNIKSIVTKEQFEQISYKLGE